MNCFHMDMDCVYVFNLNSLHYWHTFNHKWRIKCIGMQAEYIFLTHDLLKPWLCSCFQIENKENIFSTNELLFSREFILLSEWISLLVLSWRRQLIFFLMVDGSRKFLSVINESFFLCRLTKTSNTLERWANVFPWLYFLKWEQFCLNNLLIIIPVNFCVV